MECTGPVDNGELVSLYEAAIAAADVDEIERLKAEIIIRRLGAIDAGDVGEAQHLTTALVRAIDDENRPARPRPETAQEIGARMIARAGGDAGDLEADADDDPRQATAAAASDVGNDGSPGPDLDALASATTTPEILAALAADGDVPTEADLYEWLRHYHPSGFPVQTGNDGPAVWQASYLEPVSLDHWGMGALTMPSIWLFLSQKSGDPPAYPLTYVHAAWRDGIDAGEFPLHPALALVKAWQQWTARWTARQTPPDRKQKGILPAPMRHAREGVLFEELPRELDRATPLGALAEPAQQFLPGLLPQSQDSIIPVLPISLYVAGGGRLTTRGQGAPIAQRLLFEALMSLGFRDRGAIHAPQLRLRDLVDWIWPNGWQRGRDLPRLQEALWELDNMRIHFDRALWRLISVDRLPADDAGLDDPLRMEIKYLPGSERGALIDRPQLRRFGLQSAPAWRSFLRLAYIWDAAKARNIKPGKPGIYQAYRVHATRPAMKRGRNGILLDTEGKPITKTGGKPVTDWRDARAVRLHDANGTALVERNPLADAVPVLDLDELARLGFDDKPTSKADRRNRAARTREALNSMERQGAIVIERESETEGWRILEPAPPGTE